MLFALVMRYIERYEYGSAEGPGDKTRALCMGVSPPPPRGARYRVESPIGGAENDVERAFRKAMPKPPDMKPLGGLGHLHVGLK